MKYILYIISILLLITIVYADITVDDSWLEYMIQKQIEEMNDEEMRIMIVDLPEKALLPDSHFTIEFLEPFELGSNRKVIYLKGDGWKRGIFWRYFCEKWGDYVTVNKTIHSGSVIPLSALTKESGWIPNETTIKDYKQISGMTANEKIEKGSLIFEDQIDKTYDVQLRDVVKVRWMRNGIQLTSKGRALERGIIGEKIRVLVNRKTLEAEILATKEVVIK